MIKSKRFGIFVASAIMLLLGVNNWPTPVQANGDAIMNSTPTPTATPYKNSDMQGEVSSAEEQEELKSVVQSYFEIRYRALSVADAEDFKQNGFGNLASDSPEANVFLLEELAKLAVDIKHAELNHLRYVDYKYFLEFRSITVDANAQTASISVVENNEVIYEISVVLNPKEPIVSRRYNIEHTIVLGLKNGRWKIVSDNYNDYLWMMLRQREKSTDEILQTADEILHTMKASPDPAEPSNNAETMNASGLLVDTSSHDYDRDSAADYAFSRAYNYNPNYPAYTKDCQNFVSQALYEGGDVSMEIPSPLPPPSNTGQGEEGWYLLNGMQRGRYWNDVDAFYNFVTQSYLFWEEGPEGSELTIPDGYTVPPTLMKGDVIQFQWLDPYDDIWDHSVIVVDIENGLPYVASHTTDYQREPFSTFTYKDVRFIHIERSDGYPPIKADIMQGNDDTGTITRLPNLCGYSGLQGDYEVYLGRCFGTGADITSGLQFRNINIPPGAQIKYAYLRFTVDGPFTVPLQLKIDGETTGNPVPFSSSNPPESASRQLTNNFTAWNIEDTNPNDGIDTLTWILGMRRTTPDLSPFIGSVVNGSWAYGNTLSIIIKNDTPLGDPPPVRRVIGYERATSYLPAGYSPARLIAAYDLAAPGSWPPIQESAPFYSFGTKDGWILESSETSGKGGSIDAGSATINVGDDSYDKQYRGILHFDTSGLSETAVITNVVLKIKQGGVFGTNPFTTHGNLVVDIKKPYFGSNANLAKSDFEASVTSGGLAGAGIFSPAPSGDWYTVALESTAFPYINRTGTTQIRLAFTLDDNDDLNPDFILFFSGNYLVEADRPKLIIYYYEP